MINGTYYARQFNLNYRLGSSGRARSVERSIAHKGAELK
jgi:hypothetical protein